ncbi:co-chaperone YbbN [Arthrobacter sp. MYb211]|uniref:tetratricopeptide repeat protein n=1 Tax=Micrococcaceae TaxID=1268 RepID=UPI000CFC63EF|nr:MULTISPECIES: tetratricopeptide repeat protein [unclassified Arthrobacter]PQZ97105.1 co-chaperone YbbN [Arthrobacter sp. MYb224]PRA00033.1 co-chaperone YbbN [Arthrobacter sp. MYb229]PRA08416.1 co-chaperone YbbN [Arthrobacter sp. MYb221]PRB48293.1 co-chaperone YbbN [Arthrobacter sp. MYb216]PRC03899.1 co-chaperone YbbN [Arthrobacter sp. MYb211]
MTEPHIPSARGAIDLGSLAAHGPQATEENAPGAAASWTLTLDEAAFQQFVGLSQQVPAIVSLGSPRVQVSADLDAALKTLVDRRAGKMVLGLVDAEKYPNIAQAFKAEQIPMVIALVNGQPVPLFQGPAAAEQIDQVLNQLAELGVQQGLAGSVPAFSGGSEEQPLPPLHQKAVDAIDAGDYAAAEAAYLEALNEKPNDQDAQVGVYQVRLLSRTQALELNEARAAAAENPDDLTAQLNVADLDLVGGHVEDAFARLVSLISRLADEDRERIRRRLIELYAVIGNADPRVAASRQKLARVLF